MCVCEAIIENDEIQRSEHVLRLMFLHLHISGEHEVFTHRNLSSQLKSAQFESPFKLDVCQHIWLRILYSPTTPRLKIPFTVHPESLSKLVEINKHKR